MHVCELTVENCRIIQQAHLELTPSVNVFIGGNASGKSSLIEALSLLSYGRSFRTQRIQDLITFDQTHIMVRGKIHATVAAEAYPVGIHKTTKETRIRVQHQDAKQVELSRHVPLVVIHPDTVQIVTGSPAQRRRVVDWIAFYRYAEFHSVWKQYQRVLQQRNACLSDSSQRYALKYWDQQWVILQANLTRLRQFAVQCLVAALADYAQLTTPLGIVELQLSTGFPKHINVDETETLLAFLQEKQEQEIARGMSLYGAHRADLQISLNGQLAERVVSRGQLKLLSIALLLAKARSIADQAELRSIVALDDLGSELDESNQILLYQALQQTQQQLIITGTNLPPIESMMQIARMFHVKQGQFLPWNGML